MADVQYKRKVKLANRQEFISFLKSLVKKYGRGNVPLEEACKFEFRWDFISTK